MKTSVCALSVLVWLALCLTRQTVRGQEYEAKSVPSVRDFLNWMRQHGKRYDSEMFKRKFQTYVDNHFIVEKLNQIYYGKTEFKLSSFADLTPSEFKSKVLMQPRTDPFITTSNKYLPRLDLSDLPDSFDWRPKGTVTPVKNQGSVGTCWAFSTAQNLEGLYKLKGNNLTNVSVEQIVDCDGSFNTTTGHADCGVYGGWPYLAIQYVQKAGGIASEDDYPYCSGLEEACAPCGAPDYNDTLCGPPIPYCFLKDSCQAKLNPDKFIPGLKVIDWFRTSENETDIAEQLMSVGPLSVALNADLLQFYHKGIFNPHYCNPEALNHAVLLVGWGVEKSKSSETPYWIVKNSWGPKWGESGYFKIIRGKGKCGINTEVVTAVLE